MPFLFLIPQNSHKGIPVLLLLELQLLVKEKAVSAPSHLEDSELLAFSLSVIASIASCPASSICSMNAFC